MIDLLAIAAHPDDLRRKLVKITEAGQEAAGHPRRILSEPPADLAALPPADLDLLDQVLARLIANDRLPTGH